MKNNNFGTKAHMLETLRMAYQFALQNCMVALSQTNLHMVGLKRKSLSLRQEKELGKRLACYWGCKMLVERPKIGEKIVVPVQAQGHRPGDCEFIAKVVSYKECDEDSVYCVDVETFDAWIVDWATCQKL